MAYLLNTLLGSLTPMCVTALVTLAITLIFKTSFTTNFAQGVISAFGAYAVTNALAAWKVPIWGASKAAGVRGFALSPYSIK